MVDDNGLKLSTILTDDDYFDLDAKNDIVESPEYVLNAETGDADLQKGDIVEVFEDDNGKVKTVVAIRYTAAKIDEAVAAVACRINEDYRDKPTPLFVGVLNGSFMFMSDLIKKIEFNNELSFVKLASYEGTCSTGCVKNLIGLNNSIEGRHVIIVEDIVDTGESIEHMIGELKSHNPASIEVCTLFFKPDSYRKQLPIKYRAMEIGNEFIVGYGLDYDQLGRSLKDIYVVTE